MKWNPTLRTERRMHFKSFQGFKVSILEQFFPVLNAEFAYLEKVRGLYSFLVCNIYTNVQTLFKTCFPCFIKSSDSHVREKFYCIKSMRLLVYKYLTTTISCWFKWKDVHHILQKH